MGLNIIISWYSDNQKTMKKEDDFQNQVITLKFPISMSFNKSLVKLFALNKN